MIQNEYILKNAPVHFESTEECALSTENTTVFLRDLYFIYCDFNNNFSATGLFLYLGWLIVLFATIGTVVDHFFCPCLEYMCKSFNLSQNVAGVTFLAFGNGAPEIFSSVAGAKVQRSNLVIAGLFGSAMFLTCVVAGTIMMITPPFEMVARPFLRDVIVFTFVSFWTYLCIYLNRITLLTALSFILAYVGYLFYILVCPRCFRKYIYGKEILTSAHSFERISNAPSIEQIVTRPSSDELLQHLPSVKASLKPFPTSPSSISSPEPTDVTVIETDEHEVIVSSVPESETEKPDVIPSNWVVPPIMRHWDSVVGDHITTNLLDDFDLFLEDDEDLENGPLTSSVNETVITKIHEITHVITPGSFMLFFLGICPVNYHLWPVSKWWNKLLQSLRAPIVLVLKLTIPIVTCDAHRLNNWCRPLYAFHCITTPLFILFSSGEFTEPIYSEWFQPWMLVLVVGLVLAIVTLVLTVNNAPPRWLICWAVLGFFGSIGWMYFIATKIVSLLTTFGKILNLSDEILGLTILSWGNGIPDFIADVTVSKSGYPQMAISACFGGPLIIILLGMGISFTIATAESQDHFVDISYGKMTTIFSAFLYLSLISALSIFTLMQFRTHKFYGMYLIFIYLMFIMCAMMHEFKVY